MDRLGESLDNLEQNTCKNSLEFPGAPEGAYETSEEVVLKIAEALNDQVVASDNEISHKLKRKNSNNIKFCSHKTKTKLQEEGITLKNFKASDLFPIAVTPYRRTLVDSANEKRRDGDLVSVWTTDSKIFVKTSVNGTAIRMNSEYDLANF